MITPQQFMSSWNVDNLVRYQPAIVDNLRISDEAKRFLTEAGLPIELGEYSFDLPPNNFPHVTEVKYRSYYPFPYNTNRGTISLDFPIEYQRYRVFGVSQFEGTDYDPESITNIVAFFCLDEQEGGRIVLVHIHPGIAEAGYWAVQFLNTSLLHFAEFLCLVKQHREWEQTRIPSDVLSPWDQYAAHGKEIGPLFHAVDPPACEEETGWWELIYSIEHGMP